MSIFPWRWGAAVLLSAGSGCVVQAVVSDPTGLEDADQDGWTVGEGDCDDDDPDAHPQADEVCDWADNDCNGIVDDDYALDAPSWYLDRDGDSYGDPDATQRACQLPEGCSNNDYDCDDGNPDAWPGAPEWCDGIDTDCDGELSAAETTDRDGDSYTECDDCDDASALTFPGAPEQCDAEDNDCDGVVPRNETTDGDGDGFAVCGDCDDDDSSVHPGAFEACDDGRDNDCDGATDETSGAVFVTERYAGELLSLDGADGSLHWALPDLGSLVGVALAPSGAMYVAQYDAGSVAAVHCDGSGSSSIAAAVPSAYGLWYDIASETLLVTTYERGTVVELDPATGATTELVSGFRQASMAVRRPGEDRVYIADRWDDGVYTWDPSSGTRDRLAAIQGAHGLLLAAGGVLYVTTDEGWLYQVDTDTGESELLQVLGDYRAFLCHDPAGGGLLVATHYDALIERYDLSTGSVTSFSTEPALPVGCAVHMPADGDEDGHPSIFYGGTDCDDDDASVYPGSGC